ncbi:MAG: efflux RND transporter permease subunit, partial [Gammaproteobacteria bacterium]
MMRALVALCVRHSGAVTALTVLALLLGSWGALHSPLDVFPEFVPTQVDVQTEAPGFAPQQVEELVTKPIENAVNGTAGLATLRSESIPGLSVVTITFAGNVDVHVARQGIAERLAELGRRCRELGDQAAPARRTGRCARHRLRRRSTADPDSSRHRQAGELQRHHQRGGGCGTHSAAAARRWLHRSRLPADPDQVADPSARRRRPRRGGRHRAQQHPHTAARSRRGEDGAGTALRRCLDHGQAGCIVVARESIRRQHAGDDPRGRARAGGARAGAAGPGDRAVPGSAPARQFHRARAGESRRVAGARGRADPRRAVRLPPRRACRAHRLQRNTAVAPRRHRGPGPHGPHAQHHDARRLRGGARCAGGRCDRRHREHHAVVVAVFLPELFTTSVQGRFVGPLALAFIFAVLASLVVAMTSTPALCALLLRRHDERPEAEWLQRLKSWQRWSVERVSRHLKVSILVLIGLVIAALGALPFLGGTFMPDFREGHFVMQVSSSITGTSLEQMLALGKRVSTEVLALPYVKSIEQQVGRAELSEDTWGPHRSEFHVELKPDTKVNQEAAQEELRGILERYPGVQSEVVTFLGDRISESLSGETAQVAIKVFGDDLDVLDATGMKVAAALGKVKGIVDLQFKRQSGTPTIAIQLAPQALAATGLKAQDVLDTIET